MFIKNIITKIHCFLFLNITIKMKVIFEIWYKKEFDDEDGLYVAEVVWEFQNANISEIERLKNKYYVLYLNNNPWEVRCIKHISDVYDYLIWYFLEKKEIDKFDLKVYENWDFKLSVLFSGFNKKQIFTWKNVSNLSDEERKKLCKYFFK